MSLLDQALAAKVGNHGGHRRTDEHIELAVAWALGQVTISQVCEAIDLPRIACGRAYNFLALALREAVIRKMLVIPEAHNDQKS